LIRNRSDGLIHKRERNKERKKKKERKDIIIIKGVLEEYCLVERNAVHSCRSPCCVHAFFTLLLNVDELLDSTLTSQKIVTAVRTTNPTKQFFINIWDHDVETPILMMML
jgi:hypothetical protein